MQLSIEIGAGRGDLLDLTFGTLSTQADYNITFMFNRCTSSLAQLGLDPT